MKASAAPSSSSRWFKQIGTRLGTRLIGNTVAGYDEVGSTNDIALSLGEEGAPEGAVVIADRQKKGRGRHGRTWISPEKKSILLSVLLWPNLAAKDVSRLTLVAAVSVIHAIRKVTGKTLAIQWPNDIVFQAPGDLDKKVCGILTEMGCKKNGLPCVVIGIGINVNASPKEFSDTAISLKKIVGKDVSRLKLTRALLVELDKDYLRFKNGRFADLGAEWESFSSVTGRQVVVQTAERKIHGQVMGIDGEGVLWIRRESGLQEKITSGDIRRLETVERQVS